MRIRVAQKGIKLDDEQTAFIKGKVDTALGRLSAHVRWVHIQLEDTNGPKGGLDKRCVVSVGGDRLETRVVEVRDVGVHAAVAHALDIAARAVIRWLGRERDVVNASRPAARARRGAARQSA